MCIVAVNYFLNINSISTSRNSGDSLDIVVIRLEYSPEGKCHVCDYKVLLMY